MMWWNGSNGMGAGGWTMMILSVVLLWALVVVAGVAIFRGIRRGQAAAPSQRTAAQILEERFARGEIDVEEYHARQDALRPVR